MITDPVSEAFRQLDRSRDVLKSKAALEAEIAELREAANALRGPVAVLLGMHPDDLSA